MELDLHGYKHADVIDKLNHFFFWEYPNCDEYIIITGNSNRMKKIVINWLEEHKYCYYIPSYNLGMIKVSE